MERDLEKKYSNGEVTIVWKPGSCTHSANCWNGKTGLPAVFDPRKKPWIRPEGAATERIVEQVKKCPSGALSFYYNDSIQERATVVSETRVEAVANGPLLVYGNISIKNRNNETIKKSNVTAFCRCGQSGNKPFCDGSHVKHNFEG
jgi:uncharacterized Fe-S cluster protein YjdI